MAHSESPRVARRGGAMVLALSLPFLAACRCKTEFTQYSYSAEAVDPGCDVLEGGARATLSLVRNATGGIGTDPFAYGSGTVVDAEVLVGGRAASDVVAALPEIAFTVPEGAEEGLVDVSFELVFEVRKVRGKRKRKECGTERVVRSGTLEQRFLYYDGTRPVVTALTNVSNPGLPPCAEEGEDGSTVEVPSGCESGGEIVLLDGANFEERDQVRFGGMDSPEVTFLSDRQLYAVTPPGTAGEIVDVVVLRRFEVEPPEGAEEAWEAEEAGEAEEAEESSTCVLTSIDPIRFCYTQCAAATAAPAASERPISVSGSTPYLALGDVGGSPPNDVVVAADDLAGAGWFEVLHGDGAGGLTSVTAFALPGRPSDVVLADFEGDGDLDAAVTLVDLDQVAVLVNDGGFDPARLELVDCGIAAASGGLLGPDEPVALLALDYDGDGLLDLVTANQGSGTIGVLAGDGSGSFSAAFPMGIPVGAIGSAPFPASALAASDLDGDAKVDLVVGDSVGSQFVTLENTSAGLPTSTVHGPVPVPEGATLRDLVLADFLGSDDVAVVDASARLHLFRRLTSFEVEAAWTTALEGADPVAVRAGDVYGASGRDVVTACQPNALDVKGSPPGATIELVTLGTSSAGIVDLVLGVLNSSDPTTHDDAVVSFADGSLAVVLNQGDGYD